MSKPVTSFAKLSNHIFAFSSIDDSASSVIAERRGALSVDWSAPSPSLS